MGPRHQWRGWRKSVDKRCGDLKRTVNTTGRSREQVRGSIVVSISACHAEDPGSIPGRGACGNPTRDRSFPRLSVSRLPSNCLTKLPAAGCLSAVLRLCLISVCAGLQLQQVRGSIVVSISACHAEDPGSIPGRGVAMAPPDGLATLTSRASGHATSSRWLAHIECTDAVACSMALLRLGDRCPLPADDLRHMRSGYFAHEQFSDPW